jgi:hypothetical protein
VEGSFFHAKSVGKGGYGGCGFAIHIAGFYFAADNDRTIKVKIADKRN